MHNRLATSRAHGQPHHGTHRIAMRMKVADSGGIDTNATKPLVRDKALNFSLNALKRTFLAYDFDHATKQGTKDQLATSIGQALVL
jgi:N-formylglutamate amidohydrolase